MRTSPRGLAAAVLSFVALSLAACGGSDETTGSNETTEPTLPAAAIQHGGGDNGDKGVAVVPDRQSEAEPKDRPARDGYGTKDTRGEEKRGGSEPAKTGKRDGNAGGSGNSPESEGVSPHKCPKATSAAQCAAAGEALEKSSSSRPVPSDECPPALDAATCEQAGKVYAEAEAGSREVQPNECPRAMTEEQCRLAGEAYAEATK